MIVSLVGPLVSHDFELHSPLVESQAEAEINLFVSHRLRCLHRPRRVYLLLRPQAAARTTRRDPKEETVLWYGSPTGGHDGHCSYVGWNGIVQIFQLDEVSVQELA